MSCLHSGVRINPSLIGITVRIKSYLRGLNAIPFVIALHRLLCFKFPKVVLYLSAPLCRRHLGAWWLDSTYSHSVHLNTHDTYTTKHYCCCCKIGIN